MFRPRTLQSLSLLWVVVLVAAENHSVPATAAQQTTQKSLDSTELAMSLVVNQLALLRILSGSSTTCSLQPPLDVCIYTHQFSVDGEGIQHPITTDLKNLYQVNETWQDGNCLSCVCKSDWEGKPNHVCVQTTCPPLTAYPDQDDYQLQVVKVPGSCCPNIVRTACMYNSEVIEAGGEVRDPNDSCTTISCSVGADGSVVRRVKETRCDNACNLGYVYKPPGNDSSECCGHCIKTQCVHEGNVFALGERWESEEDACYEYSCELRDDLPIILAVKKECPYFDPECPEEKTMPDVSGCCKLCNATRQFEAGCQPKVVPLTETVGRFQLSTWRVGTCRNPNPVPDFRMCSGHCNSSTEFQGEGRQAKYVSTCSCCRPSRYEKIRIQLNCDSGVTFSPVYDNIAECQCLECDSGLSDYP